MEGKPPDLYTDRPSLKREEWLTAREKVPGEMDMKLALLLWLGCSRWRVGSLGGEGMLLPASSRPPPSLCLSPATPLC